MKMSWLKGGRAMLWLAGAAVAVAVLLSLGTGGEGTASREERRIAEVLQAMAGVGRVEVALFYADGDQTPTGAVVVAQGAEDMGVKLSLIRAVRTLLNLPETAVDVFAMEGER